METNSEEQQQLLRALIVGLNFLHQTKPLALWIRLTERIDHDVDHFLDYVTDTKTLSATLPVFLEETINPGSQEFAETRGAVTATS